uniref:Uncharacterized protein LOC104217116 n=1 Tax=Nicotiana sylvestris TaxID=4096 RepID=A0A1U7VGT8_NICSY|nr:PREDICTED: uncharacterized protein LOC104217116 [Nicotiana sylvestris]
MGSPWTFVALGMDVIGSLGPAASNRHYFILVAIDYFTKWVEASTYKAVTKKVVVDIVRNNIICRFRIPDSIITGNAANLNTELMREIFEKFRIFHRNFTTYRLQMNGAVEGYWTTIRTSTRAMPNIFVYDTEAVIPVEVEIPSLRVIQEAKLDDVEWIRARIANAFNKRMKPRQFTSGQVVLKKIFPRQEEAKGMFAPNWQGPYMVPRALSSGALILVEMDGRVNTKPINSDAIKRYYA